MYYSFVISVTVGHANLVFCNRHDSRINIDW